MSQQLSGETFLLVVTKSGLVEPQRLTRAVDEFAAAGGDRNNSLELAERLVEQQLLTRWQAEKLLLGKHKGYFLGKYRLLALLGRGGMSSVYLAEHVLMRRNCAIKVLPAKRVGDTSYLARFHREAQAVASLDDPNIVRAYDVDHQTDRDAEIHFLVMEYVEGCSLQELVARQGVVPFTDAVDYVRQAALGLAHAHKAGLVHRDIKPGNLLLDKQGTVKILDLGLARFFNGNDEEQALTIQHDEKVLGTADYLAPEQALDSHSVDARADIYSLGCTLYFMLTGHPPFTEGTLAQRLMAHQTKEPPGVELTRTDTPASLVDLLHRMMAKKPEDRFQSAAETSQALLQWLHQNADADWRKAHSGIFTGLIEAPAAPKRAAPVAARVIAPLAKPGTANASPAVATPVTARPVTVAPIASVPPAATASIADPAADAPAEPAANEPELAAFFAGLGDPPTTSRSKPGGVGHSSIHTSPSSKVLKTPEATPRSSKKLGSAPKSAPPPSAAPAIPSAQPSTKVLNSLKPAAQEPVAPPVAPPASSPSSGGPDFSFLSGISEAPPPEVLAAEVEPAPVSAVDIPATPFFPEPVEEEVAVELEAESEITTAEEELVEAEVEPVELEPEIAAADEPAESQPVSPFNELSFPDASDTFEGGDTGFPQGGFAIDAVPSVSASRKKRPAAPAPKAVAAPAPAGTPSSKGGLGKYGLPGGIAAGVVVLIVGVGFFLGWFSPTSKKTTAKSSKKSQKAAVAQSDAPAPAAATTNVATASSTPAWVSKRQATVGPSGDFNNLTTALQQLKTHFRAQNRGDRFLLKVTAGSYTDRIALNGKEWKGSDSGVNVVIQGEGAVVLQPSGADPVIQLTNVEGVQLQNLTVVAEGKPVGIELAEMLDRCVLQNIRTSGASDAAVVLSGALGPSFSTDRVTLDQVDIRAAASAVGVRATKGRQSDSVDSQNILFRRCRFLGPLAAGVSIKGTDSRGYEFRECIFSQTNVGVELLEAAGWGDFQFVNNTFYQCPIGLRIEKQPATSSKGLSFRRNLFLGTSKAEVVIENGFNEDTLIASQMLGPMLGNWTDRAAPATPVPGELALWGEGQRGATGLNLASTDPAAPSFLAPAPGAPQAAAVGGQNAGDPAWIGAKGP